MKSADLTQDCVLAAVRQRLADHHRLYPIIKVRDYLWEYVLFAVMNDVIPEYGPHWDYGSQKIGRDITLDIGLEISCKSGQIHTDGRIKISSSRLSRLSDVEKVKNYLCTVKTEDYIACLSTKKGDTPMFDGEPQYLYSVYDAGVFDYQNMTWELFGKDSNLRGRHASGVMVTCTKAMGWQVWYYLPTDLALFSAEINPTTDWAVPMALPVYQRQGKLAAEDLFRFS